MTSTIFQKIINRELNAEIVYEDDDCLAFKDVNPQAPVHILLIPKESIKNISNVNLSHQKILGHLMVKIPEIAKKTSMSDDFRVVINNGSKACQTIFHLHLHILGGRKFTWPPG